MAKRLVRIQKGHLDPEMFKHLDGINIFHISVCVRGAGGLEELRGFSLLQDFERIMCCKAISIPPHYTWRDHFNPRHSVKQP